MSIGLKPYPAYKASSVEWLGEIPEHWNLLRVRNLANIVNGATPASGEPKFWYGDITWITPEDLGRLRGRDICGSLRQITSAGYKSCGTKIAPEESVVISTRAPIGHIGILKVKACVNQGCRILVPQNRILSTYLYYQLVKNRLSLESYGQGTTFFELTRNKLAGFAVTLPPTFEQICIVRFLDHIDRRIQRYIRAKHKLIQLLEEKKLATIHKAVTGQIDIRTGRLYAAYKPSGVEWLEDVPEHWEVGRLKQFARILGGYAFSTAEFKTEGIPVVRMQNIHRGVLNLSDAVKVTKHLSKSEYSLKEGDILYGLSGSIGETGSLGNHAVVRSEDLPAQLNQRIGRLQPIGYRLTKGHLVHCLCTSAFYEQVLSFTSGTAQFNVSTRDIGNVFLALPQVKEQHQITARLSKLTGVIDDTVASTRREVEALKEYRFRLISDVVTGNLDVREAVANLPEVDTLDVDISDTDVGISDATPELE